MNKIDFKEDLLKKEAKFNDEEILVNLQDVC